MHEPELVYHAVAKAEHIDPEEPMKVEVRGTAIALYKVDGRCYATDDQCTHGLASLSLGYVCDGLVECPFHGGAFEIATGKAVKAPCTIDIRTHPVRVDDGTVFVGLPE